MQVDLRLRQLAVQRPRAGAGQVRLALDGEADLLRRAGGVADHHAHDMAAALHHLRRDQHGEAGVQRLLHAQRLVQILAPDAAMRLPLRAAIDEHLDPRQPGGGERPAGQREEAAHGLDGAAVAERRLVEEIADAGLRLAAGVEVLAAALGTHRQLRLMPLAGAAGDDQADEMLALAGAAEPGGEAEAAGGGCGIVGKGIGHVGAVLAQCRVAEVGGVEMDAHRGDTRAAQRPALDAQRPVLGQRRRVAEEAHRRGVARGRRWCGDGERRGGLAHRAAGGADHRAGDLAGWRPLRQLHMQHEAALRRAGIVGIGEADIGARHQQLRRAQLALAEMDAHLLQRRPAHRPAAHAQQAVGIDLRLLQRGEQRRRGGGIGGDGDAVAAGEAGAVGRYRDQLAVRLLRGDRAAQREAGERRVGIVGQRLGHVAARQADLGAAERAVAEPDLDAAQRPQCDAPAAHVQLPGRRQPRLLQRQPQRLRRVIARRRRGLCGVHQVHRDRVLEFARLGAHQQAQPRRADVAASQFAFEAEAGTGAALRGGQVGQVGAQQAGIGPSQLLVIEKHGDGLDARRRQHPTVAGDPPAQRDPRALGGGVEDAADPAIRARLARPLHGRVLPASTRARSPTLCSESSSRVWNLMPYFSSSAMMISICLKESQPGTSFAVSSGRQRQSSRMNTSWKISVSAG